MVKPTSGMYKNLKIQFKSLFYKKNKKKQNLKIKKMIMKMNLTKKNTIRKINNNKNNLLAWKKEIRHFNNNLKFNKILNLKKELAKNMEKVFAILRF
jgi:hypothetical protein